MKKYLYFVFIIYLINSLISEINAQIPNYIPIDSLKAWYPFDGNANDMSGNGNNGTVNGATLTSDRLGNANSSYYFNGVGNSIHVNNSNSLNINGHHSITISCWINASQFAPNMGIVSKWGPSGGNDDQYALNLQYDSSYFIISSGTSQTVIYSGQIQANQWYNIVGVYDADIDTMYLYINGNLSKKTFTNISIQNISEQIEIGHNTNPNWFNGKIDDIGIWNRALSPCEVYQLYTGIIQSSPTVNLGNDTTLYQGSNLTLNAGNTGSTFLWSTNDTTQTINVNTSGTYWVKVTNSGGCFSSDGIYIRFISPCNLLCNNDFEDIQHTSPGTVILLPQSQIPCWRTTAIDEKIEIWSNGAYGVNSYSGNQFIELNANYVSTLYQNFYANAGTNINIGFAHRGRQGVDSMSVSIGPTGGPYTNLGIYGDGASWNYYNLNYSISNTGNYSLRFNSIYAIGGQTYGNFLDDIQIILTPIPIVNLGNDTTLYQGSNLTLNAGNTGSTFLWSTNDTTQTINVNTSGTYWVKVTNSGGCFSSDTINVDFTTSTNTNPMNDTTICKGESVTLTANAPATGNTWEYFQDFENTVGSEWSDTNRFTFNSTKVLGPYGNQNINLNINGLPVHDSVEISFDLYIHDTWDGNNGSPADFWRLKLNSDTIINTSFNNHIGGVQSYPQQYPSVNPSLDGSFAILPIICSGPYTCTALYKINKKFYSNSNSIQLIFSSFSDSQICDESWSIDNVKVKLLNVNAIPQYLWSTGATTASITVSPNQTTNYTVTVTNGSTTFADSATVNVLNPQINYGQDTTICKGESVVLIAQVFTNQNICSKSQLPSNLQQGLVAFYPFCGNANDESGNANNGTVNGATLTTDRFGNANSAYSFDGTNDDIHFPMGSNIQGNNPRTVSAWHKVPSHPNIGYHTIYRGGTDGSTGLDFMLAFQVVDTVNNIAMIMVRGFWNDFYSVQFNYFNNTWYHVAVTYDGTIATGLKLFLNGNQLVLTQQGVNGGTFATPPVTPYIGFFTAFGDFEYSNGLFDDYFIFNRSLSTIEIQELYNLGTSNSTASTYLWSTNHTTQSITVTPNQTTTYTLSVTNGNISCMDTITVNVLNPQINNGQDTTICKGETICLNVTTSNVINHVDSIPNFTYIGKLNNHLYYRSNYQATWPNAKDSCIAKGGHLATISNSLENTLLFNGCNGQQTYFGFTDEVNEGEWLWVTGEKICYSNWYPNEPNNLFNEDYAVIIGSVPNWNDGQIITQSYFFLEIEKNKYLWSTNDTVQSIMINPIQTTTYSVLVSNGNSSCSDTITVFVSNPQIILGNDTTICQGQSKTLAVGSGYTSYIWSTGATTQQITVQNTGTYWVKAISNQGCTVSDTINLTFLPVQSNIIRDTILCLGQSVIYNPGAGYTNHFWSTGATTASLNVNLPGTFWLQVKQPNGCVIKDTAIVKYDSLNIVVSSFTNPTCYGGNNGSINTTTTGLYPNYTYSWNTTPVITTQNISNLQAGNYTVTVTDSKGCTKSVSKTLTAPNPVAVSLGNDTAICQGQNLNLQATQVFTSYLWSTGATTQSINVSAQGTYWLKGTNSSGCSGYDTINITVNPVPLIQIVPANPNVCKGDSVTLQASSNIAGTTFNWSNGNNSSSITVSPLATVNYTVIGSKNACKDTATVTVTVNPVPVVTISPANPSVCKGEAVSLTASSNLANTTFLWNNNSANTSINVSPNMNTNYFVVGSLSTCKDTAFVTVTTKPLPVLNVTADKNPLCEGETVKLTANSDIPATTYVWSNTSIAGFINVSPVSTSYYYVTGTASNCHDTAGINIVVISKQSIDLGEDRYLCAGDEVNLTANNLTGSYLWSNGNNSNSVTLTEPGVYWLRVDNNGCIASDTIEMKKCSEIWVPNVFTPNGDGTNEIFKPVTTEIQKLTMYIYNRWGEMIFETSDVNGGWDGKLHGNDVPTGVYFWLIRYNENRSSALNIEKEIKGSVTLLR